MDSYKTTSELLAGVSARERVPASLATTSASSLPAWLAVASAWLFAGSSHVASAGTPTPFTEEAVPRGIDYAVGVAIGYGYGVAFVDLDGDLDPDIITLGRADGLIGVYENDGSGSFTDRSADSGIPALTSASGVIAGDYDGDGDLDLYFSNFLVPNSLMRNDGSFTFIDIAQAAGVDDPGASVGCAWGDYDNDGRLDLYVANYTIPQEGSLPNRLYHNLGDGIFEDVAPALGVDDDQPTLQAVFFDFDQDGDADLYLATDKANNECKHLSNHLFENVAGTFIDITEASGTAACIDSMCIAVGDFNGNGHQDLYITNIPVAPYNALLINEGDGTFSHQEDQADVASYRFGWGSVFFDYDNDGRLDLYVANLFEQNRLYRHDGSWPAQDLAPDLRVNDAGLSYAVATADIDDDGDLDLLLSNNQEGIRLFVNNEGATRQWVKFNVVGQAQNHFAIGANVKISVSGVWQVREVIAGCNYKSQNELLLHFGLDDALLLDEVVVSWPGGVTTRGLVNLPANYTWTLYPPERLGDADGDALVNLADFHIFVECYETPFGPGCEMMDFDGDSDVDCSDWAQFLLAWTSAEDPPAFEPCAAPCPADFNNDGSVGASDLAVLLGAWGPNPGHPADFNGDGIVNAADLAQLLGTWGPCQ